MFQLLLWQNNDSSGTETETSQCCPAQSEALTAGGRGWGVGGARCGRHHTPEQWLGDARACLQVAGAPCAEMAVCQGYLY